MSNKIQNKKFHFIYKTTNLLNEKYYYGMHSTANLKDGYLGSGKRIRHSINKHGKENFKCEILEFLPDRETLIAKEIELITKEMLQHPLCMNLKPGGQGGFCNEEHMMKCSKAGNKAFNKKMQDESFKNSFAAILRDRSTNAHAEGRLKSWKITYNWTGKNHLEETKQRIKNTKTINKNGEGVKNSQFGSCWINNGVENKKIKKELFEIYFSQSYKLGRINVSSNKIAINNCIDTKFVNENELELFISNGWKKGSLNGKSHITGKKYINKNGILKTISIIELDTYLENGWKEGRK